MCSKNEECKPVLYKLELIADILIRSFIIGMLFLLIWFISYITGLINSIHGSLFNIPVDTLNIIHYSGMMIVKIFIFNVFLIPYICIKMVLCCKKHCKSD